MKKNFLPLALLILLVLNIDAQNNAKNFGVINLDELNMKSYAADPTAEAVIISDYGESYFSRTEQGFRIIFERTTRIKILTNAGTDYATVEIPIYLDPSGVERVEDVEGITYNLVNGFAKITRFDPTKVFEEKNSEHWNTVKFALPDVSPGSVIEYRYTIDSPYLFNFRDWVFQQRIPTVYSEYVARMIPFYEYVYILQGANKFDVFSVKEGGVSQQFGAVTYVDNFYTFGMRNVPAFKDEEYITSLNDYILKLDFQLAAIHRPDGTNEEIMSKWPMLIQEMLKKSEFGGYIRAATRNAEDILNGLDLKNLDDRAKMEAICQYVKDNYAWDGIKEKFANQTVKELLSKKTGNSAAINLFLDGLLVSAGFDAYPVLLSTRDHGKIHVDYPFQQFLNYAIILVKFGDEILLLDATEPLSPFGMLPARCMNERGLIVDRENEQWVSLTDDQISDIDHTLTMGLNTTGDSLCIQHRIEGNGNEALRLRRRFMENKNTLVADFMPDDYVLTDSALCEDMDDPELPFRISMSTRCLLETVGDKILIYPFKGLVFTENPLKLPYRSYPVDMTYASSRHFHVVIKVPEGYTCTELPKAVVVNNELIALSYKVLSQKNEIQIEGLYAFKNAVYLNKDYFDLKAYFSKIVTTFNNPIVLARAK